MSPLGFHGLIDAAAFGGPQIVLPQEPRHDKGDDVLSRIGRSHNRPLAVVGVCHPRY
jgi:hypothetical protein